MSRLRETLWLAAGGRCSYCQVKLTLRQATLDEVVPRSKGGKRNKTNSVIACRTCNSMKGDKSVEEFFEYMRTSYNEHGRRHTSSRRGTPVPLPPDRAKWKRHFGDWDGNPLTARTLGEYLS
jgi:hypothetical protein